MPLLRIDLDAHERAVVRWMPVTGRDHEVEAVRDRVDRRGDLVAALDRQRPAGVKSFWKSTTSRASIGRSAIFAARWSATATTTPAASAICCSPRRSRSTLRRPAGSRPPCSSRSTSSNGDLHAVFTKRNADLRRHAGEISFPGGRRDEGEDLLETALREAEEEIGLAAETSRSSARSRRPATIVTNYVIYPFVGLIEAGQPVPPQPDRGRRGRRALARPHWSPASSASA